MCGALPMSIGSSSLKGSPSEGMGGDRLSLPLLQVLLLVLVLVLLASDGMGTRGGGGGRDWLLPNADNQSLVREADKEEDEEKAEVDGSENAELEEQDVVAEGPYGDVDRNGDDVTLNGDADDRNGEDAPYGAVDGPGRGE